MIGKTIKGEKYQIFRYQLNQAVNSSDSVNQLNLIDLRESMNDFQLIKNNIFSKTLSNFSHLQNIIWELKNYGEELFYLELAKVKKVDIVYKSGVLENEESFPRASFIINNNPDYQFIAIHCSNSSFYGKPLFAANFFKSLIGGLLFKEGVIFQLEPIYLHEDIKKIISKYHNQVKKIKFEILTPNMSNISKSLSEDLKDLGKISGSPKIILSLSKGEKSKYLNIVENKQIDDMIEYSSKTGSKVEIDTKSAGIIKTSNMKYEEAGPFNMGDLFSNIKDDIKNFFIRIKKKVDDE